MNGPSVKGAVAGFGKKASSGGIIQFGGNGGAPLSPMNFDNFATEFSLSTETPKKPGDLKGAEVSLSIIEQGGGAGWSAGGGDTPAIPEPEPSAVPLEKVWKKNARRNLGTSSEADDPFIRRVVVTAMWRGHEIQWGGASSTTAPSARPGQ